MMGRKCSHCGGAMHRAPQYDDPKGECWMCDPCPVAGWVMQWRRSHRRRATTDDATQLRA